MKDAGLTQVDTWIGTGGGPVAEMVVPSSIRRPTSPTTGTDCSIRSGPACLIRSRTMRSRLPRGAEGRRCSREQYFDKFMLTRAAYERQQPRRQEQARLRGHAAIQPVAARCREQVARPASATTAAKVPPPNPWATAFALVAGQRDIVQWEPTRGNHPISQRRPHCPRAGRPPAARTVCRKGAFPGRLLWSATVGVDSHVNRRRLDACGV